MADPGRKTSLIVYNFNSAVKDDPAGNDRRRQHDKGKALAGKNTLNRFELTPVRANNKSRYKKNKIEEKNGCRSVAFVLQSSNPVGWGLYPTIFLKK